MIYITGDCHGNFDRFKEAIFPEQKEMTKDDYVIIAGDFGGIWRQDPEDEKEIRLLEFLESRPFTTLFVDGNHENFDRLYAYPEEKWSGGRIHRIRPSVLHLMRGQVFEIDGKKIFTFGGASSHDVQGGILDPKDPDFAEKWKAANRGFRPFRIKNYSWWERELPTREEMDEGRRNLEMNRWTVDFIVTHCAATSTQRMMGGEAFEADVLTDYLEEIRAKTEFQKWFFGHYHENMNVNSKELLLWEQIIRIS